MAELQGKQQGNSYKVEKKKETKKKTKNTTSVKLPNARKSITRQRQMAQGKANFNGWWGLISMVLVGLLIFFILAGGINQRATIETVSRWVHTVGEKVSEWINPDKLTITENGVYLEEYVNGE